MRRSLAGVAAAAAGITVAGCSTAVAPWEAGSGETGQRSFHVTTIHDSAAYGEGGWVSNGVVTWDADWLTLEPTGAGKAGAAAYESPVVRSPIRFNEALLSWNLEAPDDAAVRFDLRVGDTRTGEWSPWLYIGRWGADLPPGERLRESELGHIEIDYFRSDRHFDAAQYRIVAVRSAVEEPEGPEDASVRVRRIALTFSNRAPLPEAQRATARAEVARASADELPEAVRPPRRRAPSVAMDVPFRSQKAEDRSIAGRICSPTSVTMVLAYRGVEQPVATVAARALDQDSGIYGNWPYNVQAAYDFGVPGYLTRINDWAQLREILSRDQPLIVSIQARSGELNDAPYRRTDGHLLVIRGMDENGDILVNDPAAPTPEEGVTTYARRDMERVWLQRGAGTAYVLLPRE